jgi:Na+-translocating ferredoxin:NAD+ oxidoreductase RnfA subunit
MVIGVGYMVTLGLTLAHGSSWSVERRLLAPLALLVFALLSDTILLVLAAERLLRQRRMDPRP